MDKTKKRALFSVSDKEGIVDLAQEVVQLGFEIISTGGTHQTLKEAGVPVTYISEITHFPEILDGRVKTLHPMIHGAILGRREDPKHQEEMAKEGIQPIDLVVVNLYPFQKVAEKPNSSWEELIENIDIGGPSMVRSAAKNHKDVFIVVDPADYPRVLSALKEEKEASLKLRMELAMKAYTHTAEYDGLIQETLRLRSHMEEEVFFQKCIKVADLRYGENPEQKASLYKRDSLTVSLMDAVQLQGKELSYNNWLDTDSALRISQEFDVPTAVIIKHTNPCGVANGSSIEDAFAKAYEADPVSAFGGILALNGRVEKELAEEIVKTFWEVVLAPKFSPEAREILSKKGNLRLLELPQEAWIPVEETEWKSIQGGWLLQDRDLVKEDSANWQTLSEKKLEASEISDYEFAWKIVKHVKSNGIVIAKNRISIGVGAGQMNRVGSAKIALEQAGENAKGAVMASDAFFPFGDTVELAGQHGITGVIQPGGSMRDSESTEAANKYDMVMIHTGIRHFRH